MRECQAVREERLFCEQRKDFGGAQDVWRRERKRTMRGAGMERREIELLDVQKKEHKKKLFGR